MSHLSMERYRVTQDFGINTDSLGTRVTDPQGIRAYGTGSILDPTMDQSYCAQYRATVMDRIDCSQYRAASQEVYVQFVHPCMTTRPQSTKIGEAPPIVRLVSSELMPLDRPPACFGRTRFPCMWISVLFGCGLIFGCFIGYFAIGCSPSEML